MPAPTTPRPSDPLALARAIRTRLDERGWTVAEVARRGDLPRSTVQTLLRRELGQPPREDTLAGLARGLELPLQDLRDAVAQAVGYYVEDLTGVLPDDPDLRLIVAVAQRLAPEDRHRVAVMARALLQDTGQAAVEAP